MPIHSCHFASVKEVEDASPSDLLASSSAPYSFAGSHELTLQDRKNGGRASTLVRFQKQMEDPAFGSGIKHEHDKDAQRDAESAARKAKRAKRAPQPPMKP